MRLYLLIVICLILTSVRSASAGADAVLVVFSADIAQYRQSFEGFRSAVLQRNGALRTLECYLDKEGADGVMQRITRERPRLVLAVGPEAAKLVRERVKGTPVVASMVLRPHLPAGPNLAWVLMEIPLRAKLERIRKGFPDFERIGIIYSPDTASLFREVAEACRALGLKAVGKEILSGKGLPEALNDIAPGIDVFLMVPDTKIYFPESVKYLLTEGLRRKLPIIGLSSSFTRGGALISFEADYRELGRQAGETALQIIDGARPGDMEPSRPRKIRASLNLAVAERLGIIINPRVVEDASDVFR